MKKNIALVLLMCLILAVAGCGGSTGTTSTTTSTATPVELNISAAASLTSPMTDLKAVYEKENPNVKLTVNFGSSGSLQKQIEEGAPVDVFLSAGQKQMDALKTGGLLDDSSIIKLLGNELVLIVPAGKTEIKSFDDLATDKAAKIGLGDFGSVPAGQYAEESLTNMKLLDQVKPKAVFGKDVKEVLAWVEGGNADAGIVYSSDAQGNSKVTVVATAPSDSHKPIVYPAAVIKASKNAAEAQKFLDFLSSSAASDVFKKYGFTVIGTKS